MAVSLKKMQDIADRLATGESLVSICKRKGMPSYSSVTRAVQADDDLWDIYRRGRVLQAEYFGDTINELARSLRSGQYKLQVVRPKKGRGSYRRVGHRGQDDD